MTAGNWPDVLIYRGSPKHKNWQSGGGFGTICPNWTHEADGRGFTGDTDRHAWNRTKAHALFVEAFERDGRRWSTAGGIAFTALRSADGTWHGFPIPWDEVPEDVQHHLLEKGDVTRREIKRWKSFDRHDIRWALKSDED
ncbi:hypothetical protein [Telmatospirillum sp.]|uniref:hypothetical protein n=1 Tax=Telmatospirillum sp. TaxID=2079197 RepID=UPI00283FF1EB|nr:hypothetical protein [Telmatospirillum sp.]MDR3440130.1 hypothetical protein [Telmatospirillum sp.]